MTTKKIDYNIALLVDGPNMYRTNINEVGRKTEHYGRIMIKEAFLTKSAPETLIEFFVNTGYTPIINSIKDIDTSLSIRATEIICSPYYNSIDMIALASQDVDYIALFQKSRLYDKRVLVIGSENGNEMSQALKRNSDYFEIVKMRDK